MSRYTIEDPNPGTPTTYRIYGPDGAMIGTLFGEGEAETERLKRWIEAAPESDGVMDGIIKRANDPQLVYQPSNVMSRYRIENHVANSSTTYNVLGPDGKTVAAMFSRDIPENRRLRAYIEAHDKVMAVLRGVGKISKRSELEAKAEALIARIEGGTE